MNTWSYISVITTYYDKIIHFGELYSPFLSTHNYPESTVILSQCSFVPTDILQNAENYTQPVKVKKKGKASHEMIEIEANLHRYYPNLTALMCKPTSLCFPPLRTGPCELIYPGKRHKSSRFFDLL